MSDIKQSSQLATTTQDTKLTSQQSASKLQSSSKKDQQSQSKQNKSSNPKANHKRRPKGISAYEASDEESIAEFEKLENQLDVKQGELQGKKEGSSKASGIQQQDIAPPSTNKIDIKLQNSEQTNKEKSKCHNIFCCGFCCSKNAENVKSTEKKMEANLSKPISMDHKDKHAKDIIDQKDNLKTPGSTDAQLVTGSRPEEQINKMKKYSFKEEEEIKESIEFNINSDQNQEQSQQSINNSNKSNTEPVEKKDLSDDEQNEHISESELDKSDSFEKLKRNNKKKLTSSLTPPDNINSNSFSPTGSQINQDLNEEESDEHEQNDGDDDDDRESNKTQEADSDNYKQAQLKKMYVIPEEEEDQFSERSLSMKMKRHKSLKEQASINQSKQSEIGLKEITEEDEQKIKIEILDLADVSNINGSRDNTGSVKSIKLQDSQESFNKQKINDISPEGNLHLQLKKAELLDYDEIQSKQDLKKQSKTFEKESQNSLFDEDLKPKKTKSMFNFAEYMDQQNKQKSFAGGTYGKNKTNYGFSPKTEGTMLIIENSDSKKKDESHSKLEEIKNLTKEQVQQLLKEQKPVVDKNKLSSKFYNNFEQFLREVQDPLENAQLQNLFEVQSQKSRKNSGQSDKVNDEIRMTKEQALKRIEDRKYIKESNKKRETSAVKEKALKKEQVRNSKHVSALVIQKHVRGHLQRKEYQEMIVNLRAIKKFRQISEKLFSNQKQELVGGSIQIFKGIHQMIKTEQERMMNDFIQICVISIQKAWRGHKFRKDVLPSIKNKKKADNTIQAFIKAWRLRKAMQNKDIFIMRNYIKDLTKVQDYFIYVEKCENMMLLRQLKKDRKRVIQEFIEAIDKLQENGNWIKGYIGNKIIENNHLIDEATTEDSEFKTPIKDFSKPGELKELISTERFLYDQDILNNPYIFESDEFIRQKYLEKKYQGYSEIKIENDEFVKQNIQREKAQGQGNYNTENRAAKKDIQSREKTKSYDKNSNQGKDSKIQKDKKGPSSIRSENPRDNIVVGGNKKLTFEEMLEDAMQKDGGSTQGNNSFINKQRKGSSFLKKREKYDPKKALEKGQGDINNKNVEKKRIFKSNKDQDDEEMSHQEQQDGGENKQETRGTFSNVARRQSAILVEENPYIPNRTILPPSLSQKLYKSYQKTQKFLRFETGRVIGSGTGAQLLPEPQLNPNIPKDDDDLMILSLEELEKIYQVYHSGENKNDFFVSSGIKREKGSIIPVLNKNSLFFTCYDDHVYESVLDDQRKEYIKLSNDNKPWLYGNTAAH